MPSLKVKNNGVWQYISSLPGTSDCIVAYGDTEPTDLNIKVWYDTSEPDVGVGSGVEVDSTLSQPGCAADAAAVGNMIVVDDGYFPDGCKLQLIPNKTHTGNFIDIGEMSGFPIVGHVDNNVINLEEDLEQGTYELKYIIANNDPIYIASVEVV